jgi:hypothetical protein
MHGTPIDDAKQKKIIEDKPGPHNSERLLLTGQSSAHPDTRTSITVRNSARYSSETRAILNKYKQLQLWNIICSSHCWNWILGIDS